MFPGYAGYCTAGEQKLSCLHKSESKQNLGLLYFWSVLCRSHACTAGGCGRSWQTPLLTGARGRLCRWQPRRDGPRRASGTPTTTMRVGTREHTGKARVSSRVHLGTRTPLPVQRLSGFSHLLHLGTGAPEQGAAAMLRMVMQGGRPGGNSPQLQLPLLGLFHLLISQVLFSSEFSPVSERAAGSQR